MKRPDFKYAGTPTAGTPSRFFQCRLSGGETCDRDPERAATNVGEPDPMAEFHALRVTPMFTAYSKFDIRSSFVGLVASDFHQFPYPRLIDGRERVIPDNF